MGTSADMTNDNRNDEQAGPEAGATPEAVALHGDRARAEQHEQPEAVTLPGDTRIATSDAEATDNKR